MNGQETEVKFYVRDLKKIETRLLDWKARLIQPRVYEINYRYDLPDGSLRTKGLVLRLRYDTNAYITFKGPGVLVDGIFSRRELEFTVSDFGTARNFLEALGYVQILVYEKYRAIYELSDCLVMLDELPIGDFVEIEGSDSAGIRKLTEQLGLDFESAVGAGYAKIFDNYNSRNGLPPGDLTFDAMHGKKPSSEELNVRAAD
ncbi:MAG TPA: class IV adenylate cyclase [Anaerolineales bacterium]|nr:class IV adenylate cyclase [Anaerolineales bacterium]